MGNCVTIHYAENMRQYTQSMKKIYERERERKTLKERVKIQPKNDAYFSSPKVRIKTKL